MHVHTHAYTQKHTLSFGGAWGLFFCVGVFVCVFSLQTLALSSKANSPERMGKMGQR